MAQAAGPRGPSQLFPSQTCAAHGGLGGEQTPEWPAWAVDSGREGRCGTLGSGSQARVLVLCLRHTLAPGSSPPGTLNRWSQRSLTYNRFPLLPRAVTGLPHHRDRDRSPSGLRIAGRASRSTKRARDPPPASLHSYQGAPGIHSGSSVCFPAEAPSSPEQRTGGAGPLWQAWGGLTTAGCTCHMPTCHVCPLPAPG